MSGGSYNYLYCKSAGEFGPGNPDFLSMLRRLEKVGYAVAAARHTRRVGDLLEEVGELIARLEKVWHAVEWRDSCDWGDEQLRAVLIGYEAEYLDEEK